MPKRQRIDSATGAVQSFATAAAGPLLPPPHSPLPEAAMPFWDAIARGRAREEWDATPALLSTAASLAWTQWQISKLRRIFDGSDAAPEGVKEAMLAARLLDLNRLEMAYLRTLQQHGRGAQGEKRDIDKRRAAHTANQGAMAAADDFIARPTFN